MLLLGLAPGRGQRLKQFAYSLLVLVVAGGDVYIYRTARVMGKCCLSDSAVSRVTPPGHSPPAQHLALISTLVSCVVAISTGIQMDDGCAFTLLRYQHAWRE